MPSSPPFTPADVERFVTDGYLHLPEAFPRDVAAAGREILWAATGCDPDDGTTWTAPVIRLDQFGQTPFRTAATTPVLHAAFDQVAETVSADRPVVTARGRAGDVFLCHPFLVHGAQPHRGTEPRFVAQPPLLPTGRLVLDGDPGACTAVERAVRLGLATADR